MQKTRPRRHWGLCAGFAALAGFGALMTADPGNEGAGWTCPVALGLPAVLAAVFPDVFHAPAPKARAPRQQVPMTEERSAFNSLEVEVDDRKFYFDASTLEHKRANEKRELVYELTGKRDDGTLTFTTAYSEKGQKTKLDDFMRQLHKLGVEVKEETVERAFRVFERQSEVDYFINKNARAFLREQFDLWMFQYVFSGESEWTEQRIKQLQVLKDIALKNLGFVRSPMAARNMESV